MKIPGYKTVLDDGDRTILGCNDCDINAYCENDCCVCKPGYTGNGVSCLDNSKSFLIVDMILNMSACSQGELAIDIYNNI